MNARESANDPLQALFSTWLKEHAGLVFKVARAFARTEADQQDLVQDILLHLWCSMPQFEGRAKVSTWIYRVALNTALAWRRRETRHRAPEIPLIEIEELPATEESSAHRLDRQELIGQLYDAIHQLPKMDAALVLLYLDDLSYREMAEVLGISENHVGVKLNRARKMLADLMKEVTYEP